MNPSVPYGHVPSISWGTDRDGLIAEYGRLKRCLSSGTLAPPSVKDVFQWRSNWMRTHHMRMQEIDEKEKKANEQMTRLQTRMHMINHAIYYNEVALGRREPEPPSDPEQSKKKYRAVPLLLREMTIEQSAQGDQEIRLDPHAPAPKEDDIAKQWTNKQLRALMRGQYRASDGYLLQPPKYDVLPYSATLGVTAVDGLTLADQLWESDDEEDEDEYVDFVNMVCAKVDAADAMDNINPRIVTLQRLESERFRLRRIMHAVELEIKYCVVRRSELSFRRTEQQRVTHYYCRMNQIRGLLRNMGDKTDLDGDGKVTYDEKRARAATPSPEPEPCPW